MNPNDSGVDDLIAQFWRDKGSDEAAARQIRSRALAEPLTSAIVAGRALCVIKGLEPAGGWAQRVADFEAHVAHLINRGHQVDMIGDVETDPAAVFGILGEDIAGIEIESFEPDRLRKAREGRPRPDAGRGFLQALGPTALSDSTRAELDAAAAELVERGGKYQCHAMFVTGGAYGVALGVQVHEDASGKVTGFNQADKDMSQQAEAVLGGYFPTGARWGVEWELPYGGGSVGLALAVAALAQQGKAQADPLLAATGRIDPGLRVGRVEGVAEKVRGAVAAGFRRVLVPAENEAEARDAVPDGDVLTIIVVERLDQLQARLRGVSGAVPLGSDGTIRFIRKLAPLYGLDVVDQESLKNAFRLAVADAAERAYIDVFKGRRGTVNVVGKGSAKTAADRLVSERLPGHRNEPRPAFTNLIAAVPRQEHLQASLNDRGAEPLPPGQHELWHYVLVDGGSKAHVVLYTTGKCVVQAGQAPAHDEAVKLVKAALEGLGEAAESATQTSVEETGVPASDTNIPHIGTDEAGKGDYFGPLVCAACFVDADTSAKLRALGVRDSKTLSDKTIHRLAEEIRSLGRMWAVTTIQPARYNTLYAQMRSEGKNLNTLLAWGHARSIEDLLGHGIEAEYAVIDKFADERYLREKVLAGARRSGMRFDHRVRGESDIAVAASSILARDAFVRWLADRSRQLGIVLPKGASEKVITVARRIVAERGEPALAELAKLSFKTTQSVLGKTDG